MADLGLDAPAATPPAAGDDGMLERLLFDAPHLAAAAHRLLHPVAQARRDLRARLLDDGGIIPIGPPAVRQPMAAVDGGSVRKALYAADLLMAVAASADGLYGPHPDHPCVSDHWAAVLPYNTDNGALLSGAMAALEIRTLARLTHPVRILDGSHVTPLISVATAMMARHPQAVEAAMGFCDDTLLGAVEELCNPASRTHPCEIVALPKADSATVYGDAFNHRYGLRLGVGDKVLAAQILEPGEMLTPRAATELGTLNITAHEDHEDRQRRLALHFNQATGMLKHAASERRMLVTYLKPESCSTVVKMEAQVDEPLPVDLFDGDAAVTQMARLARLIADETTGPFMVEPFAQHAVDLRAKTIAAGADALEQSLLAHLPSESGEYIEFLARAYRT